MVVDKLKSDQEKKEKKRRKEKKNCELIVKKKIQIFI